MFLDLTLPISEGMASNPDHCPPSISRYATIDRDGWEASRLVLDSHLGTHLDAPRHFILGGLGVGEVALDVLIGLFQVVHLEPLGSNATIRARDLPEDLAKRVAIATAWSETRLHSPDYFSVSPLLDESAAVKLVEAGTRIVGIDAPTVDRDGAVHRLLLRQGCVIVENLTNLTRLGDEAEITILPLPLRDGDGSPVRAVSRVAR